MYIMFLRLDVGKVPIRGYCLFCYCCFVVIVAGVVVVVSIALSQARTLVQKQNECCLKRSMSGLVSAVVIIMTCPHHYGNPRSRNAAAGMHFHMSYLTVYYDNMCKCEERLCTLPCHPALGELQVLAKDR